jgi:hypothetical protein
MRVVVGSDGRTPAAYCAMRARLAGFPNDLVAVASRAIRSIGREPEFLAPSIVIPLFLNNVTNQASAA